MGPGNINVPVSECRGADSQQVVDAPISILTRHRDKRADITFEINFSLPFEFYTRVLSLPG